MAVENRGTWYRIAETVCVTWSLVMVGISDSLIGPSMTELQVLLQTDLGHLNYVVMTTGLLDFGGSILAGVLAKTSDVNIRLAISLSIGSAAIAISAAVPNFYFILLTYGLQGLTRGIVYCYSIEKCSGIWTKTDVSLQLVLLGITAGGVISPLIIKLFLCVEKQVSSFGRILNITNAYNLYNLTLEADRYDNSHASFNETVEERTCLPEDILISYAYIVLGVMCTPPIVAYLIFWKHSKGSPTEEREEKDERPITTELVPLRPSKLENMLSVLFVIYFYPLIGGYVLFSTFLTEFGVKGPLRMDKSKMVLMTSLYWGSSLFGRIVNILLTPLLGVQNIIILNMIPLLVSQTVLVSFVSHSDIVLWLCTCAIGIFISPYIGAGYAWFSNHVTLRPRIIAASSASLGLGGMLIPFLGGLLFQKFGPMSFLYFFYSHFVFAAGVFCLMIFIARRLTSPSMTLEFSDDSQTVALK